tara:strand:+ start:1017 stop:1208 length:192 start_codon:yes stop_codon:yes gene_type:complete
MQEKRMRGLRDYLKTLEKPIRAALLEDLKPHLKGVIPSYYFSSLYPRGIEDEGNDGVGLYYSD